MVAPLQEGITGVWQPLERIIGRPSRPPVAVRKGDLATRIAGEYTRLYEHAADRFTSSLGDDRKFALRAAWKQREITRYSRELSRNLEATAAKRRRSLDEWIQREVARGRNKRDAQAEANTTWAKWMQHKQRELDGILAARAQLEAQTDIMVHSGLANPEKDRIMYFGGSPGPCPLCVTIQAGNPYTIGQSRAIGGVAHPGCRDHWSELAPTKTGLRGELTDQWRVSQARLDVAAQQVRDGSVRLWQGQPLTPAQGWAVDRERALRPLKDLWKSIPGYVEKVQAKQP